MRALARWRTAALGSGVVLVLAACATQVGPSAAEPGAPGDGWPGERTFVATAVTENGQPKAIVEAC